MNGLSLLDLLLPQEPTTKAIAVHSKVGKRIILVQSGAGGLEMKMP
jgi:hypothetical protein